MFGTYLAPAVVEQMIESGKDPGTPKALHKLVSERWHAELDRTTTAWTLTVDEGRPARNK